MGVTLIADGAFFISLIFGVVYLWLVAPNWPPVEVIEAGLALPLVVVICLFASPIAARAATVAIRRQGAVMPWLAVQAVALLTALAAMVALISGALPDPQSHAYAAASFALLAYVCLHLGLAALFVFSNATRLHAGFIGPRRNHDLRLTTAWQDFTAISGVVAVGIVLLLPKMMTG